MTGTMRLMRSSDFTGCERLSRIAEWNQLCSDWQRALVLEPAGCFVVEQAGRIVGTLATTVFGPVARIAMVLVDPVMRGQGIATRLMEHALEYLKTHQVATVSLDASPAGKSIYEKLGFNGAYTLSRYAGIPTPIGIDANYIPYTAAYLDAVSQLDEEVTGMARRRFLAYLLQRAAVQVLLVGEEHAMQGFVAWRPGHRAAFIGPCLAKSDEIGSRLLQAALQTCASQPCFVDIPDQHAQAIALATTAGLTVQRPFLRMYLGTPIPEDISKMWASSGPEKG